MDIKMRGNICNARQYFERALLTFDLETAFNLTAVKFGVRNGAILNVDSCLITSFDPDMDCFQGWDNCFISINRFSTYVDKGKVKRDYTFRLNSDVNIGKFLGFINPIDLKKEFYGLHTLEYRVDDVQFYAEITDINLPNFKREYKKQKMKFQRFGLVLGCKVTSSIKETFHVNDIGRRIVNRDMKFWNEYPDEIKNHIENIIDTDEGWFPDNYTDKFIEMIVRIQKMYDTHGYEQFIDMKMSGDLEKMYEMIFSI